MTLLSCIKCPLILLIWLLRRCIYQDCILHFYYQDWNQEQANMLNKVHAILTVQSIQSLQCQGLCAQSSGTKDWQNTMRIWVREMVSYIICSHLRIPAQIGRIMQILCGSIKTVIGSLIVISCFQIPVVKTIILHMHRSSPAAVKHDVQGFKVSEKKVKIQLQCKK